MVAAEPYAQAVSDEERIRFLTDAIQHWNLTGRVPVDTLHEDCVWVPPREDPDFEVRQGHDPIRTYSESWRELFDELRWDILEAVAAGDRAFLRVKQTATGKGSGAAVELDEGLFYTFRGEKISRVEEYTDPEAARRAAGID